MKKQLTEKQWGKVMKKLKEKIVFKDEKILRQMLIDCDKKCCGDKCKHCSQDIREFNMNIIKYILGDDNTDPNFNFKDLDLYKDYGVAMPIVSLFYIYFYDLKIEDYIDEFGYFETDDETIYGIMEDEVIELITKGYKIIARSPENLYPNEFLDRARDYAHSLEEQDIFDSGWHDKCIHAFKNNASNEPIPLNMLKFICDKSPDIEKAVHNLIK